MRAVQSFPTFVACTEAIKNSPRIKHFIAGFSGTLVTIVVSILHVAGAEYCLSILFSGSIGFLATSVVSGLFALFLQKYRLRWSFMFGIVVALLLVSGLIFYAVTQI